MGFNTTVFILNDQFDAIERNPEEFVRAISHNMNGGSDGEHGERHLLGQTTVMPTQHADTFRLYGTQMNSIIELSRWNKETLRLIHGEDFQRKVVKRFIEQARYELERLEDVVNAVEKELGL